jgi:hypothetical protein
VTPTTKAVGYNNMTCMEEWELYFEVSGKIVMKAVS